MTMIVFVLPSPAYPALHQHQQQGRRTAPCSYLLILFFFPFFFPFSLQIAFLPFCLSPLTLRATQKKNTQTKTEYRCLK
ncbi:hypothetical protein BDV24DRAFT_111295 [Aspergillus arachidicola]|uniref:Uncharacterized protein n=1 Tax=Aspergillus arachidicola TaxID=656916 RepID=A0A5N6XUU5_9EURO|nr:hypothetical protein BDV24DRAFT_111295 [Aspergillus arachidicola]